MNAWGCTLEARRWSTASASEAYQREMLGLVRPFSCPAAWVRSISFCFNPHAIMVLRIYNLNPLFCGFGLA